MLAALALVLLWIAESEPLTAQLSGRRLQEGSKAIFHLEAFVARFMSDFKNYLITVMG